MSDLISRRAAIDVVANWFKKIELNGDICLDGLRSLPSAEQKDGKWIRHPIYPGSDHYYYACSECDYRSWSTDNFCSVCGAKMEGEEDEIN